MRSKMIRALVPLALAGITTLTMSGNASAATYDGQDPVYSGCATGSYAAKTKSDSYYSSQYKTTVHLTTSLFYSPNCRTVWVVVDIDTPNNMWSGKDCNIHRNSDGKVLGCNRSTGTQERISPMLNDKNVTGYAVGWGHIGNDPHTLIATTGSY